jgi:hypothetical protein
VAIKVVEHAPGMEALSLAEQKIEREALLATSLSHPNVIATCATPLTRIHNSSLGSCSRDEQK